jgi:hypothetical protein
VLSAATPAFDPNAVPQSGDLTICIECAALLTFTEGMELVVHDGKGLDAVVAEEVALVQSKILSQLPERDEDE